MRGSILVFRSTSAQTLLFVAFDNIPENQNPYFIRSLRAQRLCEITLVRLICVTDIFMER
jgi:hypothetical protein